MSSLVLNQIKLSGCKCLDKQIVLEFTNLSYRNSGELEGNNIKAIYGPNGSGKSAIVTAVYIYRNLISGTHSLNEDHFSEFVSSFINKSTNRFFFEATFTMKKKITCRHSIVVSNGKNGPEIIEEKVQTLSGTSIKDKNFVDYLSVANGELVYFKPEKNVVNLELYKKTLNLLKYKSAIIPSIFEKKSSPSSFFPPLYVLVLAMTMRCSLDASDIHKEYIRKVVGAKGHKDESSAFIEKALQELRSSGQDDFFIDSELTDVVAKKSYPAYERKIAQLAKFIQIFKPSLKGIGISKKVDGGFYKCNKIFQYKGYLVDLEFESNGIKNLVRLFSDLSAAANGAIVFIDEMDANLHGVYFNKMMEFFVYQGKGQLCFTTHNIESMDILGENSHSIDILSADGAITSWTKNGHYSPSKRYANGLIPGSPFNVEPYDFEVLFNEKD